MHFQTLRAPFDSQMVGGAGGEAADGSSDLDGARVGPPPDLPSLLLHNRIVYLGMPLVPAVTELIIAEVGFCCRWTRGSD